VGWKMGKRDKEILVINAEATNKMSKTVTFNFMST
jgi:hypothetical protein